MDDVGDGVRRDAHIRHRGDHDPRVLLDLAHRGGHHLADGHRPPPTAARGRAGEDDQTLRVAPHACGQVIDPEQVVQDVRVVGAPLQRVDQLELAVHERLVAAGDVQEHREQPAAQGGLFDGGLDGGEPGGVEGPADLADLVGHRLHVASGGASAAASTSSPAPNRSMTCGQLAVGQQVGGVAQRLQAARDAPAPRTANQRDSPTAASPSTPTIAALAISR